ncbi:MULTISPECIES: hypothetical protein [unclassified Pseudonocardia]|uniref:hypothetical protein n=1 Tax=unclassified Pseudonocardia TaxID=2619320 RepID=UPI00094B52CE|nr:MULTISPECIES: hypothetical protein [unclassified Pseudonocardia]
MDRVPPYVARAAPAAPPVPVVPAPRRPSGGPPRTTARPWWDVPPGPPVEPAGPPDADGRLPGFPAALLPRPPRPPRVVGGGLLVGIATLIGVFTLVVGAATAAGPVPGTAVAAAEISEWRDGGGRTRVDVITRDLAAVVRAGERRDVAAMGDACRDLRDDVAAARAYRPIPDERAQASWTAGLDAGADGARHCVAGTALADPGLLRQAADDLDAMSAHVDAVAARIAEPTGG